MRKGVFNEKNVIAAFKTKPVLSAREIAETLFDYSPRLSKLASTKALQMHKEGMLMHYRIRGAVMYSLPDFDGCAEDYFIDADEDSHCVPFPYNKEIITERKSWMEKATQFYAILNQTGAVHAQATI